MKVIRERNFNAFMDSLEKEADNGQWLLQEYVRLQTLNPKP
jgi:hypothetical protein